MKYLIIPALAGTLFLGGCAELMQSTGTAVTPAENRASIVVRTQVIAGGVQTAAVPKLTHENIDHLVLQIFELNGLTEKAVLDAGGNPVKERLTRNKLSNLITFSKLKAQTKYRIRASAYRAPESIPANLISTTDAGSYVDVQVLDDDRPTVTTLKVKLIDVDFDGQGTFQGVDVTPGGYRPTGPVTISIDNPPPDPDALLNEGKQASQGLLDIYTPVFKNGMIWRYKLLQTVGGQEYTGSFVQVISNVVETEDEDGKPITRFTLQETVTWGDNEPEVGEPEARTSLTWYPPASEFHDLFNEDVTIDGKTYQAAAKLGSAKNTATSKQYMWLDHAIGVIQIEHFFPSDYGPAHVRQTLEVFISP